MAANAYVHSDALHTSTVGTIKYEIVMFYNVAAIPSGWALCDVHAGKAHPVLIPNHNLVGVDNKVVV